MKVGIDLSSTNTGLVILSDDNKLIFHGNFQLGDSDKLKMYEKIYDMVFIIKTKTNKNVGNEYQVNIGIELADFKNANITNRFNLLAGMIIFGLLDKKCKSGSDVNCFFPNIKLFNSNEGQRFLKEHYKGMYDVNKDGDKVIFTLGHSLKKGVIKTKETFDSARKILKAMSRDFVLGDCLEYNENGTEDECDAYCIAYFLEKLRDRTQMHQEVKEKKVQAKKSKVQELRAKASKEHKISKLKDIVIKYKSMSKLTKAQQRALEKAENELKEIK